MAKNAGPGRVVILMGVFNGAADLPEQLQSFADQSHQAWDLLASDDGSDDDSCAILTRFAAERAPAGNVVRVVEGPRNGFAMNFLSLITQAPEDADWLAFSDQDDVWLPDRLERGIAALSALPGEIPTLYCSRTWITDEKLKNRRLSAEFPRPPSFLNALVQNIAAGNTLLLNRAAADLARAAAPEAQSSPGLAAHDWWLYQLVTGTGGTVIRDSEPTLLYRQHEQNLIGANDGWRARMSRISMLLGGQFTDWNAANITALRASAPRLTTESRTALEAFAMLRVGALPVRLWRFARAGLYRQTALGQAALWLAVILRRI